MDYFHNRLSEVNMYFDFLAQINKEKASLHYQDIEHSKNEVVNDEIDNDIKIINVSININTELVKILKANAYLILYNLIEASFREALWSILEKVIEDKIDYKNLSETIKKVWQEHQAWIYKDYKKDGFVEIIKNTIYSVFQESVKFKKDFVNKKQMNGNVDREKIQKMSELYGFELPTQQGIHKFDDVKRNRNDLAHGNLTFSECGKNASVEELISLKNKIVELMKGILENINKFIIDGKYKA